MTQDTHTSMAESQTTLEDLTRQLADLRAQLAQDAPTPAEMSPDIAAALRKPFPVEVVGKLPRLTCKACSDKRCQEHTKTRCTICGNYISPRHIHLDYVGHAEVTDRLLSVDPRWTWEPMALDDRGLPLFDQTNGLWIRLTIAGVTRIGYGDAENKKGPDAIKETISNAIRNASMRFGVALDLWGATFKAEAQLGVEAETPPGREEYEPPIGGRGRPVVSEAMVTSEQHRHMHALWRELSFSGETNRDNRLNITSNIIHRHIDSSAELTEREAAAVIDALNDRKLQLQQSGVAA